MKLAAVALFTGMIVWLLPMADAMAQAYRCGNVYQDRPCDGNQSGKPVMGVTPRSSAAASPPTNPVCAQRGADSLKIVWARESGTTAEKAMAEESNAARRQLIADVYRVRGGALEVQARIEAECKAEMEERSKAIALHEAMVKSGVMAQPAQAGDPAAAELAEKRAAAEQLAAEQRTEAKSLKARCDSLEARMAENKEKQRGGGGGSAMETLRRDQSKLERDFRGAGC